MLIYHPEIFHELTEAGACNYVSCSDEFRDKGCAACSTCFESHAFCNKCEDNSYEMTTSYVDPYEWECRSFSVSTIDGEESLTESII